MIQHHGQHSVWDRLKVYYHIGCYLHYVRQHSRYMHLLISLLVPPSWFSIPIWWPHMNDCHTRISSHHLWCAVIQWQCSYCKIVTCIVAFELNGLSESWQHCVWIHRNFIIRIIYYQRVTMVVWSFSTFIAFIIPFQYDPHHWYGNITEALTIWDTYCGTRLDGQWAKLQARYAAKDRAAAIATAAATPSNTNDDTRKVVTETK